MSDKRKILIQLDSDSHASVFDRVVAVDAGVDELFSYSNVRPADVRGLVHGAMFTRGPKDLHRTAVFIGGSSVEAGEAMLAAAANSFFGPLRVSLMLDANGANTTAAAAVLAAESRGPLTGATALVLGGTGPVGRRAALLLAAAGAAVRVGSRQPDRADAVCRSIAERHGATSLTAVSTATPDSIRAALADVQIVIAAGAAGAVLLPSDIRAECGSLRVAIDLNAVPPVGIEGIASGDAGTERDGASCFGAIGVGGTKMKIHKVAIARLFERNDLVLDATEIHAIGKMLLGL